jgi:hypothetical protein
MPDFVDDFHRSHFQKLLNRNGRSRPESPEIPNFAQGLCRAFRWQTQERVALRQSAIRRAFQERCWWWERKEASDPQFLCFRFGVAALPETSYQFFMPTVTVKMTAQQFARLERIARERRLPKSQILRESFERADGNPAPGSMYQAIADLIGSVEGPGDLLSNPKYMKDFGKDGPVRSASARREVKAKR